MKKTNKYILSLILLGFASLNTKIYAMPLQLSQPMQTPSVTNTWEIREIKPYISTVLTSPPTPEPTPTIHKYDIAVEKAREYLGVPYVWGGTTPSGFDCSGLVQYVYCQLGFNLSRTTYTQVGEGSGVEKSNLRQGDLIFFKRNGDVHHVGIYIGNGQYIHAPQTGEVVKISNLSDRSDYYTARRIVND